MKHSYINPDLVHNCKEKIEFGDIWHDLETEYCVTNVQKDDEDAMFWLCRALYEDYLYRGTNYKSYIEKGINARIMMELRKSALWKFSEKELSEKFFRGFQTCETVEEIKQKRIDYLREKTEYYTDADWQYYYLMRTLMDEKGREDFMFNYEGCFADCDCKKQTGVQDYEDYFSNALAGDLFKRWK